MKQRMKRITVDLEQRHIDFLDELSAACRITPSALVRVVLEFHRRGLIDLDLGPHRQMPDGR